MQLNLKKGSQEQVWVSSNPKHDENNGTTTANKSHKNAYDYETAGSQLMDLLMDQIHKPQKNVVNNQSLWERVIASADASVFLPPVLPSAIVNNQTSWTNSSSSGWQPQFGFSSAWPEFIPLPPSNSYLDPS